MSFFIANFRHGRSTTAAQGGVGEGVGYPLAGCAGPPDYSPLRWQALCGVAEPNYEDFKEVQNPRN